MRRTVDLAIADSSVVRRTNDMPGRYVKIGDKLIKRQFMSEAAVNVMTQLWIYVRGARISEFKHTVFLKSVCRFKVKNSDRRMLRLYRKEPVQASFMSYRWLLGLSTVWL
jgi:hypothetical protein